jgi:hypothetical protein
VVDGAFVMAFFPFLPLKKAWGWMSAAGIRRTRLPSGQELVDRFGQQHQQALHNLPTQLLLFFGSSNVARSRAM